MRLTRDETRILAPRCGATLATVTHMLAAFDQSLGQFTADLLLLFLIGLNAYLGWRLGLLRRAVAFVGLYVGVLAATNIGNGLASLFSQHSLYGNAWMFVAVVAVVVLVFEGLGWAYEDRLKRILVFVFDRVAGGIAGAIVGIAQALVLFIVALAVGTVPATASNNVPATHGATAQDISSSTLAGQVVRLAPQARSLFGPVLPGDLSSHLVEGTQVTIPGI